MPTLVKNNSMSPTDPVPETPESPVPETTVPETPVVADATAGPRQHGEFIMAGSFTDTGDRADGTPSSPAEAMPNFARRKEVQKMLKKLRDSFSLWKRIPDPPPQSARDSVDRFVLPQHTMYIK